jgi:hypothetical protein
MDLSYLILCAGEGGEKRQKVSGSRRNLFFRI